MSKPHPHWRDDGTCSACGIKGLFDKFGFAKKSNYCPNCGGKMYDIVIVEQMVTRILPTEQGGFWQ